MEDNVKVLLEQIANKYLDFDTLETRNSDYLDFKEVSVWGVSKALEEAYALGGQKTPQETKEKISDNVLE